MLPRLHVDMDGGVDDALALALIARSGAAIAGVSAVFGNTWVDQAASNARWVLALAGAGPDVYVGAEHGLAGRPFAHRRPGHGNDGMNGAGGSTRRRLPPLERPHGMNLLVMAARTGVSGLFLGPLTNLARALPGEAQAFAGWRPTVMAGAFEVAGQGQGGADFNSWSDPEALTRVLTSGVQPRLVPLDITSRILLPAEAFRAAAERDTSHLLPRLCRAVGPYMELHQTLWGGEGCRPHDAVAAAAALWPELFTFEPAALSLDPAPGRMGRILRGDGPANAELCIDVDAPALTGRIMAVLFGETVDAA